MPLASKSLLDVGSMSSCSNWFHLLRGLMYDHLRFACFTMTSYFCALSLCAFCWRRSHFSVNDNSYGTSDMMRNGTLIPSAVSPFASDPIPQAYTGQLPPQQQAQYSQAQQAHSSQPMQGQQQAHAHAHAQSHYAQHQQPQQHNASQQPQQSGHVQIAPEVRPLPSSPALPFFPLLSATPFSSPRPSFSPFLSLAYLSLCLLSFSFPFTRLPVHFRRYSFIGRSEL